MRKDKLRNNYEKIKSLTALMSEKSSAKDWNSKEDNKTWKKLKPKK